MIAGLSKAVTLYLAPVLGLTAVLLSLFAFLAPTLLLHDQVALLTVTPSTVLTQPGPSKAIDGPSVFFGVLGSCARSNNAATISCTPATVSPKYDLSVLPENTAKLLLSAPTASAPAFIAVAITFSFIFFISFTLISLRHKMGAKMTATFEKPVIQRLSAWLGFFSFLIGMTSFLIIRMWFGKAVDDFNSSLLVQAQQGPQLVASLGNGFTMAYVAYAFLAVPIIASLAKLNVQATKA